MSQNRVYIIAEAGVNHNGRLDLALQLCDAARNAGVDAVKFQTWKTENIITTSTAQAEYQTQNTSKKESQFEMLKRLELSYNDFIAIKQHCENIGVQFLSTPDDSESLDFLCSLSLPFLKIGSGEITNIPYLRAIGSKQMPVIISSGMCYLGDVERAYRLLKESGAPSVDVLHCTTNYPCPMEQVNLGAMVTIKNALGCRVGYSDHTMGIEVPIAAVALGAEIIEKHFTLDRAMRGPDHAASLNPEELKQMVEAIRNIEKALGDGIKRPNDSEVKISQVILKRIVARKPIKRGEIFTLDNLSVKRAPSGVSALLWDYMLGSYAPCDYATDQPIELNREYAK